MNNPNNVEPQDTKTKLTDSQLEKFLTNMLVWLFPSLLTISTIIVLTFDIGTNIIIISISVSILIICFILIFQAYNFVLKKGMNLRGIRRIYKNAQNNALAICAISLIISYVTVLNTGNKTLEIAINTIAGYIITITLLVNLYFGCKIKEQRLKLGYDREENILKNYLNFLCENLTHTHERLKALTRPAFYFINWSLNLMFGAYWKYMLVLVLLVGGVKLSNRLNLSGQDIIYDIIAILGWMAIVFTIKDKRKDSKQHKIDMAQAEKEHKENTNQIQKQFEENNKARMFVSFERQSANTQALVIRNNGKRYATDVKIKLNGSFQGVIHNLKDLESKKKYKEIFGNLENLSNDFIFSPHSIFKIDVIQEIMDSTNSVGFYLIYNNGFSAVDEIITINFSDYDLDAVKDAQIISELGNISKSIIDLK